RDLGQEGAEHDHERDLAALRELEDGRAVAAPLEVRLAGYGDDEVAREPGRARDREVGRGPHDLALRLRARLVAHVRAREAEVVELFGIDLGELFGAAGRAQLAG